MSISLNPYNANFKAQAAWLRSFNGTPPVCFENCFACFRMPSPSLGTQPEDVPYARTVVSVQILSNTSFANNLPNTIKKLLQKYLNKK